MTESARWINTDGKSNFWMPVLSKKFFPLFKSCLSDGQRVLWLFVWSNLLDGASCTLRAKDALDPDFKKWENFLESWTGCPVGSLSVKRPFLCKTVSPLRANMDFHFMNMILWSLHELTMDCDGFYSSTPFKSHFWQMWTTVLAPTRSNEIPWRTSIG